MTFVDYVHVDYVHDFCTVQWPVDWVLLVGSNSIRACHL